MLCLRSKWPAPVTRPRSRAAALAKVPGARAGSLPERIARQLAQLVDAPPAGDLWLHEIKLDGYRIAARLQRGRVKLLTRKGLDWTDKFPAIAAAVAALSADAAYLDGEACHVDANGRTSFSDL
jgi:bifunctional non-homologous end joining protein LigD